MRPPGGGASSECSHPHFCPRRVCTSTPEFLKGCLVGGEIDVLHARQGCAYDPHHIARGTVGLPWAISSPVVTHQGLWSG